MTGRPRNPDIDEAILRATFDLVEESGYRGLSIEGIAARCGVTKQAIYRRYHNKGEVILDALSRFASDQLPKPDTGSLSGDLSVLLRATFSAQQGASGALNRALAAEALQDEDFAKKLWTELIDRRRDGVREMLARARSRGEIPDGDDEYLIDLVYGPMWYRLLFGPEVLDDAYAERTIAAVLDAAQHRPTPAGRGRSTGRSKVAAVRR